MLQLRVRRTPPVRHQLRVVRVPWLLRSRVGTFHFGTSAGRHARKSGDGPQRRLLPSRGDRRLLHHRAHVPLTGAD